VGNCLRDSSVFVMETTSWSRTKYLNPINALSGVAYGTRSVISPSLIVRNLYLEFLRLQLQALRSQICERLPSKHEARFQTFYLFLWLFNNLGSLLFAQS